MSMNVKSTYTGGRFRAFAAGSLAFTFLLAAGMARDTVEIWRAPARHARKANPVAVETAIPSGKQLYTMACLACHGNEGRGDGPAAAALERKPGNLSSPEMWSQKDGELFWKISKGKSPMPAFEESFSDTDIWQIVNYVRTLAPSTSQQASKR